MALNGRLLLPKATARASARRRRPGREDLGCLVLKAALGEQHPAYAASLNNLADLYAETGAVEKAEPLYLQAMSVRKAALGEQHPDYAASLSNLACPYS